MTRTIALLVGFLSALSVQAQTVEAQANDQTGRPKTQPRNAMSDVPVVVYQSALSGYRAFQDEKISSWQASNDNVARIGGWRVYAREAREPESAPRDTAHDTPATPAGHPHAGHGK
ncbi:MAG: hypothetical protein D4S02_05195 [Rhodocyclaceae bacterium]|nr:MAG: hypothetical protein D4S02_05195 [Rhodocyclaceae bacterium]